MIKLNLKHLKVLSKDSQSESLGKGISRILSCYRHKGSFYGRHLVTNSQPINPQYSCLGNPMDRGAWGPQSIGSWVHPQLKWLSMHTDGQSDLLVSLCSLSPFSLTSLATLVHSWGYQKILHESKCVPEVVLKRAKDEGNREIKTSTCVHAQALQPCPTFCNPMM